MDPNQCVKDCVKISNDILTHEDEHSSESIELAKKFLALNRWLSNNGFLPDEWTC